jgi:hypothetical protein
MVQAYVGGQSLSEVATDYGCSVAFVQKLLVRSGVERRRPGSPIPERATLDAVSALREKGRTARQIAVELGISLQTTRRWLRRLGASYAQGARGVGPEHQAWRGGWIIQAGYRSVWVPKDDPMHCMAWVNGYVPEHRLVMARSLGRSLTSNETVHHINGDHVDNRLENLQLRQGKHGKGAKYTCLDCGSHNVKAGVL